MNNDASVLTVKDLSLDFETPRGRVQALRNVSFEVPAGHVLGIIGESGSGKSTLVRAALGLLANNAVRLSGEIIFKGNDLMELTEHELESIRGRQISMVFQDAMTFLNPVVTVAQHMIDIQYRETALTRNEKLDQAIKMLEQVGLSDVARRIHQYPHHFSGGMRQRIGIAMALLMKPAVLIADEPTTALDVTLEAQIMDLFKQMRSYFLGSILFVSHNLGLISKLCDHVVVMYAGRVVERGSAREMLCNPRHPYTKMLVACDPSHKGVRPKQPLPTIRGDVPNLIEPPSGCVFAPRCPVAFAPCFQVMPTPVLEANDHSTACHLVSNV